MSSSAAMHPIGRIGRELPGLTLLPCAVCDRHAELAVEPLVDMNPRGHCASAHTEPHKHDRVHGVQAHPATVRSSVTSCQITTRLGECGLLGLTFQLPAWLSEEKGCAAMKTLLPLSLGLLQVAGGAVRGALMAAGYCPPAATCLATDPRL